MKKNLLISILVLVLFGVAMYYAIKMSPKVENTEEIINTEITQENMSQEQEINQNQENSQNQSAVVPQMQILKEGSGDTVSAIGDTLVVAYTGYFVDGTVFDSSVGRSDFEFSLGAGQVIAGWDLGLVGMKVGEERRLVLPPEFAYGQNAVGPIPANSTLVFDVRLIEIK